MAEGLDLDTGCRRELVIVERDGASERLVIRNPPANALSIAVMQALLADLEAAGRDRSIRVLILGAAGNLFSAGHDLKELTAHRGDRDKGRAFFKETFALCSRLMQAIATLPLPVIAEVDGIATAAGCQLVATCDLAVASDRSRFGVNGINLGLFCTTPAVALTRLVNRKRAMEMLLTGAMIDARSACEFGLVNRVVEAAQLKDVTRALAQTIASKSPLALRMGKQAVARQAQMDLAQAYEHASAVMVENLMTSDAEEAIEAFLGGTSALTPARGSESPGPVSRKHATAVDK